MGITSFVTAVVLLIFLIPNKEVYLISYSNKFIPIAR